MAPSPGDSILRYFRLIIFDVNQKMLDLSAIRTKAATEELTDAVSEIVFVKKLQVDGQQSPVQFSSMEEYMHTKWWKRLFRILSKELLTQSILNCRLNTANCFSKNIYYYRHQLAFYST